MSYVKGELLYEGKAKKIYEVKGQSDLVWVEFKDSLTAFNAQKKSQFSAKGQINARITALIYERLKAAGIDTHFVEMVGPTEMICRNLSIVPLEVVTRNRLAGSTAKKFNKPEGTELSEPLLEFYYKDDALGDPFINDEQALWLKAARDREELQTLRNLALKINTQLREIFASAGLELIDFKLEFGRDAEGRLVLGDEITPDTCRLWDLKSGERMDKDRFRRDLGGIAEAYEEVLKRLEKSLGS